MRLVFARVTSARALLLAASSAAMSSTVLLTAFLLYAQLLPEAGARAVVVASPATEHALFLSSGAGRTPAELTHRDATVRELVAPGLAGVPLRVYAGGQATSQQLPDQGGADAVVVFLPDLAEHADLVDGSWPERAVGGAPTQATLAATVARRLGLAVGDELTVHDGREQEDRVLRLVGVWEPREPDSAFWQLTAAPVQRGGLGPIVVHQQDFAAHYQRLAQLEWVAVPADLGALTAAGLGRALSDYRELAAGLERLRAETDNPTLRLSTDLDDLAGRLATAQVVHRSGLVLPAALVVLVAAYGLVLVARLLAAQRRGENALLRARGASRRQLFSLAGLESVLVVAPAAALAAPLASLLVGYADRRAGQRSLGLSGDLAPYGWWGPPEAWSIALLAAAGCALALTLPGAGRGRTWVAQSRELSRPSRPVRHLRGGLDLALVVVAVLAWSQLRQYETAVLLVETGVAIDPLLVGAPVVAVAAGTAVALRLLPIATWLAVRSADRGRAFAGLLGVWQADRRPHAGPVLLLVLSVATAVLAPAVAATWQRSQHDQAAQAVGADLRLSNVPATKARELADLPAVSGLVPVHRGSVAVPGAGSATLLAIDAAHASGVAHLRASGAGTAPEQVFTALAQGRPRLGGVALPADAERLVGVVRFTGAESATVTGTTEWFNQPHEFAETLRSPASGPLVLYLVDDRGLVRPQPLGEPDGSGVLEVDLSLPPGTVSLVGLGAQLRMASAPQLCPQGVYCPGNWAGIPVESMRVAWEWEFEVVNATGTRTPLRRPADWEVYTAERSRELPPLELAGSTLIATVDPVEHSGRVVPFQVGDAALARRPVHAVVTPEVLVATGASVGDRVTLGGVPLRLTGTVPAVPGTGARAAVLVDLGSLAVHRLSTGAEPLVWQEWWVATDQPSTTAAAAGELGVEVLEREVLERDLLGDPLGTGVLLALWAAAVGAGFLAVFGLTVDARATAVGRRRELAVLHTLGMAPRSLARALAVEQAVLAGLGVSVGAVVGMLVAAAMAPSLVLTPAGAVPVPAPVLALSIGPLVAPLLSLFTLAMLLGALVARRARRELAAGGLRIGVD